MPPDSRDARREAHDEARAENRADEAAAAEADNRDYDRAADAYERQFGW